MYDDPCCLIHTKRVASSHVVPSSPAPCALPSSPAPCALPGLSVSATTVSSILDCAIGLVLGWHAWIEDELQITSEQQDDKVSHGAMEAGGIMGSSGGSGYCGDCGISHGSSEPYESTAIGPRNSVNWAFVNLRISVQDERTRFPLDHSAT